MPIERCRLRHFLCHFLCGCFQDEGIGFSTTDIEAHKGRASNWVPWTQMASH